MSNEKENSGGIIENELAEEQNIETQTEPTGEETKETEKEAQSDEDNSSADTDTGDTSETDEDTLNLFEETITTSGVSKKDKVLTFIKRYYDVICVLILTGLTVWTYFNTDIGFILAIVSVLFGLALLAKTVKNEDTFLTAKKDNSNLKCLIIGSLLVIAVFFFTTLDITSVYKKLCILLSFYILVVILDHIKLSISKKRYIYVAYGLLTLIVVFFISHSEYKYSALSEADRVQSYIDAFTSGNYAECDKVSNKKSEQLVPDNAESVGTFSKSEELYTNMLDKLGTSIKSMKYDSKEDILTVKYKPFTKVKKVSVDEKKLDELVEKYVTNQLSDEDLKTGIEEVYISSFDSMNKLDKDASIQSQKIKVKVKGNTVEGFKSGIEELLKNTNLSYNVGVFEKDIQSTVNVALRK